MKRSSGPRKTASNLSRSVQQQLNMYALAAGAAGVSALALTQPAAATIVYTAAHKVISRDHTVVLDLDHDGKNDFKFKDNFLVCKFFSESCSQDLFVVPTQKANQIWGQSSPTYSGGTFRLAFALAAGVRVGPSVQFSYKKKFMAGYPLWGPSSKTVCSGPWNNVENRYLGFMFTIKGKTHFGWARLNVSCVNSERQVKGLVTGYAYETVPGKSIITGKTEGPDDSSLESPNASLTIPAPESPTLGLLATGAPRLSIWRRKELAREGN